MFVLIRDIIAEEYGIRAGIVLRRWQDVMIGQKMVFTSRVADFITAQAESALAEDCEDIEEALQKGIRVSGYKGSTDTTTDDLRSTALEALQAEVEFAMIAPGSLPPEPSRGGDQFTIHGNVGALQMGSSASPEMVSLL